MGCFGRNDRKDRKSNTGCFQRSSPALHQILLQLCQAQKPMEIDHHFYEFGSVEYHIESSASHPDNIYLSISTPMLSSRTVVSQGLCAYTKQKVKEICPNVMDIVEPVREGYQLTVQLNIAHIPPGKGQDFLPKNMGFCNYIALYDPKPSSRSIYAYDLAPSTDEVQTSKEVLSAATTTIGVYRSSIDKKNDSSSHDDGTKIIKEIAAIESLILSSQLKEMLCNFSLEDDSQDGIKPIKFTYHTKEPFFVSRQPHKITVIFPMRFKEHSDVTIATSFFQELMDIGSSEAWAKAPPCTWSPIPPPQLRGEPLEDLSTNGGFVSFEIFSRHIDDKRLDKTVWNLLNFSTYVKSHVKCTKGFIQRKMRNRLEDLVKILHQPNLDEDKQKQIFRGKNSVSSSRFRKLRKKYNEFSQKISRIKYRIKIHGFGELNRSIKRVHHRIKIRGFAHIRRQWFSITNFHSAKGYTRLD